jgi:hypothetical protein
MNTRPNVAVELLAFLSWIRKVPVPTSARRPVVISAFVVFPSPSTKVYSRLSVSFTASGQHAHHADRDIFLCPSNAVSKVPWRWNMPERWWARVRRSDWLRSAVVYTLFICYCWCLLNTRLLVYYYCHVYGCVIIRRGLDWMIGFIDPLYTEPVTTINYSAIAISTLYNSLLHTLVPSVFTSHILTTDS